MTAVWSYSIAIVQSVYAVCMPGSNEIHNRLVLAVYVLVTADN